MFKSKEWKKTYHKNINPKKAWIAIVKPDKVDFGVKKITRYKEKDYMIKVSIHWEDNLKCICTKRTAENIWSEYW